MVKIQLDLPDYIDRYVAIQKQICNVKDKRETIIFLLKESLKRDKELMKRLGKQSKDV